MEHADVVFLDPARRNEHGARTFGIEDCTPNVLELLPLLRMKADTVVLKLSPMLDWRNAETAFHGLYLGSSAKGTTNVTSFTAK